MFNVIGWFFAIGGLIGFVIFVINTFEMKIYKLAAKSIGVAMLFGLMACIGAFIINGFHF